MTAADGSTIERQQYEPFGNSTGSSLTRYGYTGREKDEATGLVSYSYNNANQRATMTAANRPAVSYGYDTSRRSRVQ